PALVGQYPTAGETGVCRNATISATFDLLMNEGSVQTNFVLAEEVTGDACPEGLERVARIEDYDPTPGFRGWINRVWNRVLAWFRPLSAEAAWCAGSARGRLNFEPEGTGTRASFVLENALKADTNYQILFRGDMNLADNGDVNNRTGIRSLRSVVADGNILWSFRTGERLCTVTAIHVRDTDSDSPNLFTRADESHLYTADVISLQDGRRVALSPVTEYTWAWEPWVASTADVLQAEVGSGGDTASRSNVSVVTPPRNGSSFVEAGIRIVRDDVNVPSTTGRIVKGTQNATVLLCENPWPARAQAPFSETSGHPSLELLGTSPLATTIRAAGPYFNFATMYCRDAGEQGTVGDLPEMNVKPVEVSAGDRDLGILRQYLFTFDVPALRGDGIGVRVATNPLHLAPSAWYASRGFTGSPEVTTVDGYEAVKDGTTWYVGAVNTAAASGAPVYSQIYILSHNPDAKPETLNIVEQMVETFTLNANIQSGASNACSYAVGDGTHVPGEFYRGSGGQLVRCTADWECLAQNPNLLCASFKAKMQRDSKRIVDFQFMTDSLEEANNRSGNYPRLQAGTFVPTLSTSRWPSWSSQLQGEIGVAFPTDPVNRFLTCGVCSGSGSPCQDSSECPSGQACNATASQPGVEPATCWNPDVRQYQCPSLTTGVRESASRIYQYRAINAGDRYELATELEGALANRYIPPLLTQIRRCSNLDSPCATNENCRVTNVAGTVISSGTCNATGGTWRYHGVCEASSVYGVGGNICGDGVIGSAETCEFGSTQPVACTVAGGAAGTKLQICDDCQRFIDGPDTRCVVDVQCGNGRVDAGETCDDGALNGSYGRCNRTCTGYDAFCGDGGRSPGETCDRGTLNGEYCRSSCDTSVSCSLSCTGLGPRCGDARVDEGFEDCDGNAERTTSALCQGPTNPDTPCTTDADCGEDPRDACGGFGPFGYNFNS
ncbi:MAG: Ig-like domain-containing protein, partial [Candidatus Uhrbacteria bacterium]|nr:Ig-like domain-containing protein [Candidatus Uhrbacteria bacterium]